MWDSGKSEFHSGLGYYVLSQGMYWYILCHPIIYWYIIPPYHILVYYRISYQC